MGGVIDGRGLFGVGLFVCLFCFGLCICFWGWFGMGSLTMVGALRGCFVLFCWVVVFVCVLLCCSKGFCVSMRMLDCYSVGFTCCRL